MGAVTGTPAIDGCFYRSRSDGLVFLLFLLQLQLSVHRISDALRRYASEAYVVFAARLALRVAERVGLASLRQC
jgi:hypothetical protein